MAWYSSLQGTGFNSLKYKWCYEFGGVSHCFVWQGYLCPQVACIHRFIIHRIIPLKNSRNPKRDLINIHLGEWAIALHGRGTRPSVGFRTGNPWVRFSHTVPVPANTVPVTGTTRTRPVNCAVSNKTRSIHDTRGYISLKWCSTCT